MKKKIISILLATMLLSINAFAYDLNTTLGGSGTERTIDLGRAYPISQISIERSSWQFTYPTVYVSNDPDFPIQSADTTLISQNRPILSKLYGSGGYANINVAANANDGDKETYFISTPEKYTDVEWLTIELDGAQTVYSATVSTMLVERTYNVYLTNNKYGQTEEFSQYVKMEKGTDGVFYTPAEYADQKFSYARLVFDAAENESGKDIRVSEFCVYSKGISVPESMTSVLTRNNSTYTPNTAAGNQYYRYIKLSGTKLDSVTVTTKDEQANYQNVAPNAEVSIADGGAIFGDCVLSNINDGSYGGFTAFSHYNPYIQFDLSSPRFIDHVEVYFRQDTTANRSGVLILASNDADFSEFDVIGETEENERFGLYASKVCVNTDRIKNYRYIRVYAGKSDNFLVLSEIEIYAGAEGDVLYDGAYEKIPTVDKNSETAYRITDNDKKSYWTGSSAEIDLGMCMAVDGLSIKADGDVKITAYCDEKTSLSTTKALSKINSEYIPMGADVRYISLESESDVNIYDLRVSIAEDNELLEIAQANVTTDGEYKIYDLGKQKLIHHIEPCTKTAEISESLDFSSAINPANNPVSGRYIRVLGNDEISVITLKTPKLVEEKGSIYMEFEPKQYAGDMAVAAIYDSEGRLMESATAEASDGIISLENSSNIAKLMLLENLSTLKPQLGASEADYVNKKPWKEFYVSPNGSDSNDGSEASPFKTIVAAKNAVAKINSSMQGDIVVYLKGGRYNLTTQLSFSNTDGGYNGYRVIYKNAEGEAPVISGGRKITGFSEGENGIWSASVPSMSSIYTLLVNGEAAQMARTEEPISAEEFFNGGTEYTYDGMIFNPDVLPELSNPSEIFVHTTRSWLDVILKGTDMWTENGKTYIELMQPNFNTVIQDDALAGHKVTADSDFYIENAYELLDSPGEFYFNKSTRTLYYMPRSGEDMKTAVVEAALMDTLIKIKGTTDKPVENLTFDGIRIENASYARLYKYGLITAQAQVVTMDAGLFIDGAIGVDYAKNPEFKNCEITGVTKSAISFGEGVVGGRICNNEIYNVGDSAIVIGRHTHDVLTGSEQLCTDNIVEENTIYNTGKVHKGAPAVTAYYVADTDIIRNSIENSAYSGISLGWGWDDTLESTTCRRNKISGNYIKNFNMAATDGGGIYTLGQQSGTEIFGNYIVLGTAPKQNTGTIGIYPDEGSSYITIKNNVIDMSAAAGMPNIYSVSMWTNTIRENFVHDNYATVDSVRNNGTDCVMELMIPYSSTDIPQAVEAIINTSAYQKR